MAIEAPRPPYSIETLIAIMAALRTPREGCPWDLDQNFATIAPYTIEEAYEVADAIERGDMPALCGELGDLLFQAVYHARLAEERDAFDFADVVSGICDKMVRRHPHVFAEGAVADAAAQSVAWEEAKRRERMKVGSVGVLDDVALALPALLRAQKLQGRAAKVGFDWPDADGPRAKIDEELAEIAEALDGRASHDQVTREVGDLLFSVVNYARHLGVDAEAALRAANGRFSSRFALVEAGAGATPLDQMSLDELEARWQFAKAELAEKS